MKEKKERLTSAKRHILYKDIRKDIDNIFDLESETLKKFYYATPLDISLFLGSASRLEILERDVEKNLLKHFNISASRIKNFLYRYLNVLVEVEKEILPF